MKNFLKTLIRHIASPSKQVQQMNMVQEIEVAKEDIMLLSCSNVVLRIYSCGQNGYFTECRRHVPLKSYIMKLADDYFDLLCPGAYASQDKLLVYDAVNNPQTYRQLINALKSDENKSTYEKYLRCNDGRLLGIRTEESDELQKSRIRVFVQRYLYPHVQQYYSHRFLMFGKYHTGKTNKVLATETIADLIGANDLNPHAEYVKLRVSGYPDRSIFGIFMEDAKGICAMDMRPDTRAQKLTGQFQHSIIQMNLLDVICHDMDHSPNNYNVYLDDRGMLEGVHVFDNNDASCFSLRKSINFSTYKNCAHISSADGIINRPAVCRVTAEYIMQLTKQSVKKLSQGILVSYQSIIRGSVFIICSVLFPRLVTYIQRFFWIRKCLVLIRWSRN